ncbi:hypothetical protein ZIOFF_074660 [Zingiber officinale]|uniref:Uncharacterized protein n=1 Tax=Zingiber officinale TaxID=94328 RepID=A0A8J5C5G4_ZINOF|nr:hypothetical protein ZIOFF_074660 [Zingiber officinale]
MPTTHDANGTDEESDRPAAGKQGGMQESGGAVDDENLSLSKWLYLVVTTHRRPNIGDLLMNQPSTLLRIRHAHLCTRPGPQKMSAVDEDAREEW